MAVVPITHRLGRAYAIQDETTKLYFIYCYASEPFAEVMATRVRIDNPEDQAANWRADVNQLVYSERDKFD